MAGDGTFDISELIDRHKVGGFQLLVAFFCALAVFLDGFDTQMMGYVIPAIAKSLSVAPAAVTPVVVVGLVGLMVGALIFGIVADRIGRKSVIVFCLLLFGVGMLLTPLAGTVRGLAQWRFLTGLGLGGAMPLAIALTAEYSPQKSRATVVMTMFFGFSLGAAVAGFATAALVQRWGWEGVFYAGGALPLIFAPVLAAALPESIRVLALRGGEGARLARIVARIEPKAEVSEATRFTIREEKAPGVPVGHLFRERRAPTTVLLWLMFFMNLLCLFFLATWLPTVIARTGLALSFAAVATAMMQIGGCIGTLCFGPLVDRLGAFLVLGCVYIGAAVFIALIGLSGAWELALVATAFGAGFCVVGGQNAMNALASILYPTAIRSTGVGWALGIGRIGTMVGAALGGRLLAMKLANPAMFAIAAVPALVAAAATFALGRAERRRHEGEPGYSPRRAPAAE